MCVSAVLPPPPPPFALSLLYTLQRGQVIIQQGDRGDHPYVAEKGVFDAIVASAPLHLQHVIMPMLVF